MVPRMKNPAALLPEATEAIKSLAGLAYRTKVPPKTLALVHLRASQINGCGPCIDMGTRSARKGGETEERLNTVAAWRHTPYFTEAERAALALTEAVTRLADKEDAVPDAVWDEAARHFDEAGLAGLLLQIALVNLFNRFNVPTRQIASGEWKG
jgi:AhpD family alkylhydroperoxidase